MKMQQFIKINFITNNVITRYLILKKKIIFKNKIIFLPTYPIFQNHVIGTTNIFYLGLMVNSIYISSLKHSFSVGTKRQGRLSEQKVPVR